MPIMKNSKAVVDNEALEGQTYIWKHMLGFADSMILKCAVDLRIADIIHSHGGQPVSLSRIAQCIDSATSPDLNHLGRIMRMLVHQKIFSAVKSESGRETLYGLTHASKWLVQDSKEESWVSLGPIMGLTHPLVMAPQYHLSSCVKAGGTAFKKAYGSEMYDFASRNPEFNNVFNEGMANTAKLTMRAFLQEYSDGFDGIETLVDVGGGTGLAIGEIVKSYPHIKGINYDLPHVISTASACDGVSHVGGDMFKSVPTADAAFMMFIMHNWSDEDCVKILKNCRESILSKKGKLIILDIVLNPEGGELFDDTAMVYDIFMMVYCRGGKERTEAEWKKILKEGGFSGYNIIKLPSLHSIIEAYI